MQDSVSIRGAGSIRTDLANAELCGWLRAKVESRLHGVATLARIATHSSLATVRLQSPGKPAVLAESLAANLSESPCSLCPGPMYSLSQQLSVPDTFSDPQFRHLACAAGAPAARSGTVTPIPGIPGTAAGTLCTMDGKVGRELTPQEMTALAILARLASALPSPQPGMSLTPAGNTG